jgi:DNA-binding transcriptional LysR family regulator
VEGVISDGHLYSVFQASRRSRRFERSHLDREAVLDIGLERLAYRGGRLLVTVGHRFEEIEAELEALGELREKPAGTIRITATDYAAETILLPKLMKLLPEYPDIKVEITARQGSSQAGAWPGLLANPGGGRIRFVDEAPRGVVQPNCAEWSANAVSWPLGVSS